jgi:hypothetical protein
MQVSRETCSDSRVMSLLFHVGLSVHSSGWIQDGQLLKKVTRRVWENYRQTLCIFSPTMIEGAQVCRNNKKHATNRGPMRLQKNPC